MSAARAAFLATLRAGLRDAPAPFVEEVIADYDAHFEEGVRGGRDEEEIAVALGDPLALADELRAEQAVSSWETASTPNAGARVIFHAMARGALRASVAMLTLPLVALVAFVLSLAALAGVACGAWFLVAGSTFELPGGFATVALGGIGLVAGGIAICAFTLLGLRGLITLLARLTRGSFRQLRNPGASP